MYVLEDHGVHRNPFAGKDQDIVAGLNFLERNDGLHAIHNAAGGDGFEVGKGIESAKARCLARPSRPFPSNRNPRMSRTASK